VANNEGDQEFMVDSSLRRVYRSIGAGSSWLLAAECYGISCSTLKPIYN